MYMCIRCVYTVYMLSNENDQRALRLPVRRVVRLCGIKLIIYCMQMVGGLAAKRTRYWQLFYAFFAKIQLG